MIINYDKLFNSLKKLDLEIKNELKKYNAIYKKPGKNRAFSTLSKIRNRS